MTSIRKSITGVALSLVLLAGGGSAFASLTAEYDRITADMAQIRQLELIEPLDIEMQTREELQEWLLESVEDHPADEQADAERVLTFLGLIEPGTDIIEMETELLGEQVAGYYDPETRSMVVVAAGDTEKLSANDEITFAHEAVHALQDQHFGLMDVRGDIDEISDDEYLATTAMIEGDATLAQVLYIVEYPQLFRALEEELEAYESPVLDSAPLYYSATLLFPYDQGATFVMEIYDEGGWDAVNAMYDNPPVTTEQILHPEKYLDGEGAIEVESPNPQESLGEDWVVLDENVFGEFMIDIFLQNGGARERDSRTASEGWGGDEYVIIGNDSETAMVWNTAWDTEEDATEFFRILVATETGRLDGSVEKVDGNTRVRINGDGYVGEVQIDGDRVTYTLAESDSTLDALVAPAGD